MSELRPIWPVGLYAPGNYSCICVKCGKQHIADKRAQHCAECTIQALVADITTAEERGRESVWNEIREYMRRHRDEKKDETT